MEKLTWPKSWPGWVGFLLTLGAVVSGSMGIGVKLFGLDTIEARRAADTAIIQKHALDMKRLYDIQMDIKMTTWCLLWEVEPEVCRVSFETRGQ